MPDCHVTPCCLLGWQCSWELQKGKKSIVGHKSTGKNKQSSLNQLTPPSICVFQTPYLPACYPQKNSLDHWNAMVKPQPLHSVLPRWNFITPWYTESQHKKKLIISSSLSPRQQSVTLLWYKKYIQREGNKHARKLFLFLRPSASRKKTGICKATRIPPYLKKRFYALST